MKSSSPPNAITYGISQDFVIMNTIVIIYNIYEKDLPYAFDICTASMKPISSYAPATKNQDSSNSII